MKMKETRHIEIRTAQTNDNNEMVITGTPVVFDSPTLINDPKGAYTEVIQRSAFDGVNLDDTRLLVNHEYKSLPLARTPKTMQLWTNDEGLQMRAVLPDTEAGRSAYMAIKRGDLTGMSFSFTTDSDGSRYDVEKRTRYINKINKMYECSIVNFPAYETASVEARSQIQELEDQAEQRRQAKIKLNQIMSRGV